MKRKPFKFRIQVSPRRFVRVSISEDKPSMWKEIEREQGQRHQHELACTVFYPGATDRGCVAALFFSWQSVGRPAIVAHEAAHASQNICAVLKEKAELVDDEAHASWVEKLVEKILERTSKAPL
jgi:hypothetical protein